MIFATKLRKIQFIMQVYHKEQQGSGLQQGRHKCGKNPSQSWNSDLYGYF